MKLKERVKFLEFCISGVDKVHTIPAEKIVVHARCQGWSGASGYTGVSVQELLQLLLDELNLTVVRTDASIKLEKKKQSK